MFLSIFFPLFQANNRFESVPNRSPEEQIRTVLCAILQFLKTRNHNMHYREYYILSALFFQAIFDFFPEKIFEFLHFLARSQTPPGSLTSVFEKRKKHAARKRTKQTVLRRFAPLNSLIFALIMALSRTGTKKSTPHICNVDLVVTPTRIELVSQP